LDVAFAAQAQWIEQRVGVGQVARLIEAAGNAVFDVVAGRGDLPRAIAGLMPRDDRIADDVRVALLE
jgi:hypothetical protein